MLGWDETHPSTLGGWGDTTLLAIPRSPCVQGSLPVKLSDLCRSPYPVSTVLTVVVCPYTPDSREGSSGLCAVVTVWCVVQEVPGHGEKEPVNGGRVRGRLPEYYGVTTVAVTRLLTRYL